MRQEILNNFKAHFGQFISGEEISKSLNVSRTAIWKHINALKEEGYSFESSSKLGYKLVALPDKLLPEEIKYGLETECLGKEVHYYEELGSTNDEGKRLAERGAVEGTIVIAEEQLSGRGRLGRVWRSPSLQGIYCSIILRPQIPLTYASNITLLTAIAITKVLRNKYSLEAGIKWPNDIYLNNKKVCGILTEVSAEADRVNYLVVGMGINVNQREFPEELEDIATSLGKEANEELNRVKLLQELLQEIEKGYKCFGRDGMDDLLNDFKEYNIVLGKKVKIRTWQDELHCVALDINQQGGLVVKTEAGEVKTFYSGDVSLRFDD